ncbi:transducin beta-like protein 3 [Sitodiplosis mosellana]|uniref:transducin beta-like protein 3 n=1 Tax=Sitodiplosis mosellana TaxID=263140 RepID=UPI0024445ADE|nr:transducin beta-like protein 3 [Sitodiplosis mosellana]
MASKHKLKEAFEVESEYGAIYTGGLVKWTSDAEKIYCQDQEKINIISVADNKVIQSIGEQINEGAVVEDAIYTFALSDDDEQLCTAHRSSLIKLWQTNDGTLVKMWKSTHNGPIPQLEFSTNSSLIASGGADSSVRIWDHQRKTCIGSLRGCVGVLSVLKFNPQPTNRTVFAAGNDNKINGWNYDTRESVCTLIGHMTKVTSLSFSADGKFLVSGSRDKVLILWDLQKYEQVRVVPVYETIESAIVLPNNIKLPAAIKLADDKIYAASAGEDGAIKIWEMNTARLVYKQENSLVSKASETEGLAITQMLYNKKVSQFAVVSADHNIMIHNSSTFYCTKQFIGFSAEILDVVFVGKKDRYLAVATNSADIKIYDTLDMNCKIVKGHTDIVLSLASLRNFLLSAGKDNTIRLWEINPSDFTVRCIGIGTKHTKAVGSVAFGKISHQTFASVSQDTCIKVWKLPKELDPNATINLNCVATEIAHKEDVNCITISPNDKMIATTSQDKTAKLWSLSNLSLLGVLRGHRRGIWCARFSPVDQVLMTTSGDCTIKLWSLADMSCLKSFEGHDSSVMRAEFLCQGMQILSAGSDGLIKLWSIKSSECVTTLEKHDGRIWTMAVATDESNFVSGGADSLLVKWKDVTEDQKLAKQKEQQEFALEEQELANLLREKKHLKALKYALRLSKPKLSLNIITEVIKLQEDGLDETIAKLNETEKEKLLNHTLSWNTNSRNTRTAQLVLNLLLKDVLSGKFKPASRIKLVEDALPYTERHFKRMTEHLTAIKALEFTLKCMQPHANLDIEMKSDNED